MAKKPTKDDLITALAQTVFAQSVAQKKNYPVEPVSEVGLTIYLTSGRTEQLINLLKTYVDKVQTYIANEERA